MDKRKHIFHWNVSFFPRILLLLPISFVCFSCAVVFRLFLCLSVFLIFKLFTPNIFHRLYLLLTMMREWFIFAYIRRIQANRNTISSESFIPSAFFLFCSNIQVNWFQTKLCSLLLIVVFPLLEFNCNG